MSVRQLAASWVFIACLATFLPSAMAAEPAGNARFDPDDTRLQELARPCLTCHTIDEKSAYRVGPTLKGIVGRRVAAIDDYEYSAALYQKAAVGRVWDEATLDHFLAAPQDVAPGVAMIYAGVPDADDRAKVIAWLLSGPEPLPAEALANEALRNDPDIAAVLGIEADAEYGEYLAGGCLTCHSAQSASTSVPPIKGLPDDYFIAALLEYQRGERANPIMQTMTRPLDNRQLAALAAFFARPAP